jgi:transposase-like protein
MTTLADIARNHGVTPQAVGKWRDLALAKYGDLPYEQVGKRKQYIPDAVAKILEFAPSRPTRPGCTNSDGNTRALRRPSACRNL